VRFAVDSPLEGTGFELSVPLAKESARVAEGKCQSCHTGTSREAQFSSRAYGPEQRRRSIKKTREHDGLTRPERARELGDLMGMRQSEASRVVANNPGVAKVVFSSASKQSQSHGEPVPASMPAEVGAASPVNLAGTHVPVRVSRWARVPEHDFVEIDRLGLRGRNRRSAACSPCIRKPFATR